MKLNIETHLLSFVTWIKPVVTKLVPLTWLRSAKRLFIAHSVKKIKKNKKLLAFRRTQYPDGINLIGSIRAEIGLGQSCRLLASALSHGVYPFSIYNYQQVSYMRYNDDSWDSFILNSLPYNINILHINPYELPLAFVQLGRQAWDQRYNIAFWLWELEEFPEEWLESLKLVDEIWAPSDFSLKAIRKITDKPTYVVPYPISAPIDARFNREYFELPTEMFLFLAMYDCNSTMDRKNPMGTIQAYKQAFPTENPAVGLILKINNPQKKDLALIKQELQGYRNIYLVTNILTKVEVNSLIALSDTFVSLHRAEGFGLPPAEAMLLGTPVIATNWSSNTEFMNQEIACMVDFEFTTITKDVGPYTKGNRWADPFVDQAAGYMKKLYEDPVFAGELTVKAQLFIKEKLSMEQASGKINHRIAEIYKEYGVD